MRIKKNKRKNLGEFRKSQLITTYGSGALCDFPQVAGIVSSIDDWNIKDTDKLILHERNLEKLLAVDYFIQPTSIGSDDYENDFAIPIYRFPYMHYCPNPKCGSLGHFWDISLNPQDKKLVCKNCQEPLIPSRFITACQNGHLDDFPYSWWVHKDKGFCDNPNNLTLTFDGRTNNLDSIWITCKTCGAKRNLIGALSQDALKGLHCNGYRPWINGNSFSKVRENKESCDANIRVLQRNATNVYYSVCESALTVPPWSKKVTEKIKGKVESSLFKTLYNVNKELAYQSCIEDIKDIEEFKSLSKEQIISIIEKILNLNNETIDESEFIKNLFKEEYQALCIDSNDIYFKSESGDIPEGYEKYITSVKLIKKLREVQVLKGFRRIDPERPKMDSNEKSLCNFVKITKYPQPKWLPAVELFGEGIFIKFNEEEIDRWLKKIGNRYNNMKIRADFDFTNGKFSAQYVLLHTIAHLLIRQLSNDCGYNTSSLKERIYSTFNNDEENMCGVLIYTATTDSDGSLGGLVREGRQDRLKRTLDNMLESSFWCSNDPICIESTAQGFNSLNYSACYACTLLPETCCEARNSFLDRCALFGTIEERSKGFFSDIIKG